jgi:hypothetical protein
LGAQLVGLGTEDAEVGALLEDVVGLLKDGVAPSGSPRAM